MPKTPDGGWIMDEGPAFEWEWPGVGLFDPEQPRDEIGRWTDGGGGDRTAPFEKSLPPDRSGTAWGALPMRADLSVKLDKLNDEPRAKMENTLKELAARFPKAAATITSIWAAGKGYFAGSAAAETTGSAALGITMMMFNADIFNGDYRTFFNEKSWATGWNPKDTDAAVQTAAHEFGHVVWTSIKHAHPGAVESFMERHGDALKATSGYAKTSPAEAFAETFGAMITGVDGPGARLMRRWLNGDGADNGYSDPWTKARS